MLTTLHGRPGRLAASSKDLVPCILPPGIFLLIRRERLSPDICRACQKFSSAKHNSTTYICMHAFWLDGNHGPSTRGLCALGDSSVAQNAN